MKKFILSTLFISFSTFALANDSEKLKLLNFIKDNNIFIGEADSHLENYYGFSTNTLEIEDFDKINFISFSSMPITEIPAELIYLKNLFKIEVSDMNLTSFPKIDSLIHLELSKVDFNKIKSDIFKNTQLKSLKIKNSNPKSIKKSRDFNITEFMVGIENLSELTTLNLSNNNLKEIPKEIGTFTNLTYLDLSNNKLEYLPTQIGNLKNLKTLYLNNNRLNKMPIGIGNICSYYKQLTRTNLLPPCVLNLSNNKLSTLPKEIANIKGLRVGDNYEDFSQISLENNLIGKLPSHLKTLEFQYLFSGISSDGLYSMKLTTYSLGEEVFPTWGYEFFTLDIEYDFQSDKNITFKPTLGENIEIDSIYWSFSDGNSSNEQNPSHNFSGFGDYNITLSINNGEYETSKLISVKPRILELKEGWNLITPPTKDDINASLFESTWSYKNILKVIENPITDYENKSWIGVWSNKNETLTPSNGYWVKLNSDLNYSYSGSVYNLPNHKISDRFNLVGSGERFYRENNQLIYQYKNSNWIKNPDTVEAGEGFWVFKY